MLHYTLKDTYRLNISLLSVFTASFWDYNYISSFPFFLQALPRAPPCSDSYSLPLLPLIVITGMYVYLCAYIPKNKLLSPYNVICVQNFRAAHEALELVCSSMGRNKFLIPSFASSPKVLCIGLRSLALFPHPLWKACWCYPCSAHIWAISEMNVAEKWNFDRDHNQRDELIAADSISLKNGVLSWNRRITWNFILLAWNFSIKIDS